MTMHGYRDAETGHAPGLIGLGSKGNDDLWLSDGMYSLWTRESKRGFFPFFMGRANNSEWFGVFVDAPTAQDWFIKNDPETGMVNITTIVMDQNMDMYIMMGQSPNMISKLYQNLVGKP